jgi:tetratricopeptide (TPR) repeat protein
VKHSNSFSCAIFIILTLFISFPTYASEYLKEIIRANDLYSEKQYSESAQAYEALIQKGVQSGYLYYNLGNTYIRMGNTGAAVLNYIRARKWIPRDENLEANLKFAIQQTRDKIEPPPSGTLGTIFFWVNDFNIKELINLAMVLNFVFWINLALWMYFRSSFLIIARNALLGFLLLSFFSIGVKLINNSDSELGVVLAKQVEVKSGRAEDAVTLFQLHEGALVTITGNQENWLEVRLNEEQKGWVPKNSMGT